MEQTATRAVRHKQEFFTSYNYWLNGWSQGRIRDYFIDTPNFNRVGLRTITTWLSWFRELPEEEVEKDRPFLFHNMDDYGIPWEHYEAVLALAKRYADEHDEELTARQAKWAWRLEQIENLRGRTDKLLELVHDYVTHERERMFMFPTTKTLTGISRNVELVTGDGIGTAFYDRDSRRRVPKEESANEKIMRERQERRDRNES